MAPKPRRPGALRRTSAAPTSRLDAPADHLPPIEQGLLPELRDLIRSARRQAAQVVDAVQVQLYWQVGTRIHRHVLNGQRAEYGSQLIPALSQHLAVEFGRGFGEKNLRRMVQFAEEFPDEQIVAALLRQLGWTHFTMLIPLADRLKRDFYAELCRVHRWSTRELRAQIDGMLYERTALSKKPAELIERELSLLRRDDKMAPDLVFKDPYFLDFLGLRDTYSEKDLESAILRDLERVLLELGSGFAFIERQKRIVVDGQDFYIDLLFYHRRMRRLVLVELKLGSFQPADFGQVEFYLRWLNKYERQPGEEAPIGLVLCAEKSDERIELLELEKSGIRVAEYLTELPPKQLLQQRLHEAVAQARERMERAAEAEPLA